MKVATWNVNSVIARLERLLAFLEREAPDVLCLQELKTTDDKFPFGPIQDLGYVATIEGQKTYNGVAVLSRTRPDAVIRGFGDGVDDPAARFLGARFGDLTVYSAYFPNGQAVGSEKYAYKLQWMQRLKRYLDTSHVASDRVMLLGDFNVAPDDIDVHDPRAWRGKILFSEPERQALAAIRGPHLGLVDTFRQLNPDSQTFTWWDYRMLGFPKNHGLRIDHIDATASVAAQITAVRVDRDERKGEKPSDHAPVIATLA